MNKHFLIDYVGFILFKLISPFMRIAPKRLSYLMGRGLGMCAYALDGKHRAIAYANIKEAFGATRPPSELKKIVKASYRAFGQNFIEIFSIPLIDKAYIKKYIRLEGLAHVVKAFAKGKGVIFLGIHEGSWELSPLICANLGVSFNLFVQNQKFPRLNRLLNSYRLKRGCRIIEKKNQTRQLIEALERNEALGMTVDQGGKAGTLVQFFGKDASMSSGAVRLALKYGVTLLPVFYRRIKGPYLSVTVNPPVELKKTKDRKADVSYNLQQIISLYQGHISAYPHEYLWSYRIWKYSRSRHVLILEDGKTGHLRQSQAVAKIAAACYRQEGMEPRVESVQVKFKNGFSQKLFTLASCLSGKHSCQGCLWCMRKFLSAKTYALLLSGKPDLIISCGSSIAALNFLLARESLAKSIAILRPSVLSTQRFDLVIMPKHDKPPAAPNVVAIEGALTLIDKEYLARQSQELLHSSAVRGSIQELRIGVLLGGDTKDFTLTQDAVSAVLRQIQSVSQSLDADILLTTSRRTPSKIEALVKKEMDSFSRCKVRIIANERNFPFAVGGIVGLSTVLLVSPESISMISEAISAGGHVVVFDSSEISRRHRLFLDRCAAGKHITLVQPSQVGEALKKILEEKPEVRGFEDTALITRAIKAIL